MQVFRWAVHQGSLIQHQVRFLIVCNEPMCGLRADTWARFKQDGRWKIKSYAPHFGFQISTAGAVSNISPFSYWAQYCELKRCSMGTRFMWVSVAWWIVDLFNSNMILSYCHTTHIKWQLAAIDSFFHDSHYFELFNTHPTFEGGFY